MLRLQEILLLYSISHENKTEVERTPRASHFYVYIRRFESVISYIMWPERQKGDAELLFCHVWKSCLSNLFSLCGPLMLLTKWAFSWAVAREFHRTWRKSNVDALSSEVTPKNIDFKHKTLHSKYLKVLTWTSNPVLNSNRKYFLFRQSVCCLFAHCV